jgi:hypothetical protein
MAALGRARASELGELTGCGPVAGRGNDVAIVPAGLVAASVFRVWAQPARASGDTRPSQPSRRYRLWRPQGRPGAEHTRLTHDNRVDRWPAPRRGPLFR